MAKRLNLNSDILLEEQAVAHLKRAVAKRGELRVVGYEDNSLPETFAKAEEQFVDFLFGCGVEIAGRLVREQHCRLVDKGTGDGGSLLFSTGELGRFMVRPVR